MKHIAFFGGGGQVFQHAQEHSIPKDFTDQERLLESLSSNHWNVVILPVYLEYC